ncbi:cell division protein FtsK [Candidatus Falkowbacteria bacterium CG11_big_fil_rev_8_21_14_0_20_39_10]|uniref:Cell division protein FtsK n=1 Tax=Candidatus Falkowbacteria bacterium CG11_big_fil_rev_8_21_14_0_20_39_10 TaxID=1974570 RepID=A0A2M6K9G8_9BACT|nr:MAG: cell division protein FtsK [Candidatus Falkowbacteria bacterium CG11_big_fil_rev_8_21_14_0_20_39_10]
MARRKKYLPGRIKAVRRRKKSALDYIALPRIDLDPDTKRGIFIVLILAIGALSALGLYDLAGNVGLYIDIGLSLAFGWGKWLFPIILLGWGFFLYNEDKYFIRTTNYVGLFLFLISFQSFLHFFLNVSQWEIMADQGLGGGWTGFYLARIFYNVLGFWGGLLVLIALLLLGLMLLFDASLSTLVGAESIFSKIFLPLKILFARLFGKKEASEDEEDEEEYEEELDEEDEYEEEELEEEIEPEESIAFSKKQIQALESPEQKPKQESFWKSNHVKIDLPLSLLSGKIGKPTSGDIKNNSLIIQKALENFGIAVEMGQISVGPTVTQYTFKPAEGVKLSRITTLSNDLALALAAHPIRIEAPIPGKSLVGIEVPNQAKAIVGLREILDCKDFKTRNSNLMIALGKDVAGGGWIYNLSAMPHLLVAGATNSGKSVCLNSIIVSLLYQNNPDDLRFIMVDPKRVELPIYNGIPHLLTPVITDINKTINALKWCLNEMDRRFEILSKNGQRNIQAYNTKNSKNGRDKMPYIVFIIDELADLMVAAAKDIEASVIRLAQMARAVGIHLVLATQRPSVDVITGLIKANMSARIAFSVASGVDSKTILDSLGAEKLLGRGDMLFITAEMSKPKRLQGAFVSDQEIKKVVNYIKTNSGGADYLEGITDKQKVSGLAGHGMDGSTGDEDELLAEAKEVIINMGKASASLLQRRLSIGYARAARILDILEEIGVVGPSSGAKPREIMISREQYEDSLNQGVSGASLHNRDEAEAPENYLGAEDASEVPPEFVNEENDSSDENDDDEELEDDIEEIEEEEEEKESDDADDDEPEDDGEEKEEEKSSFALSDAKALAGEKATEDKDDEEELEDDIEEDEEEDEGMFFSK